MAPGTNTSLITAEKISKSFGIRALLDDVSVGVHEGERIGVVGLNGGGKTTLLEILAGITEPDSGRVSRVGGAVVATVTQRGEMPEDQTVADVVVGVGVAEHEWASDARIRGILAGIGIDGLLDRKVTELSGGQRRRTALAAALITDADLLILDEPTNHLDIEGVHWLAEHLVDRRSALLVVTHDRWFLDTIATRTWEVHSGRVDEYEGGYNDWVFARAERNRQADAAEERRRNLARKELAWLRRGAPARTSKPKYRIEAAEKLISDVPPPRDSVALSAFAKRRLGRVAIELENARLTTPSSNGEPGRVLLDDTTWRLAPGERIGLVGVNGSGKTTLLRALAGDVPVTPGRRIEGKTVSIGWLRQELDDLDESLRLIEVVEAVAGHIMLGDKELSASQLCERLGFSPARQRTPVGDLSGGERRRLQFTAVLMSEPNVLLLDEPTNDLDIDTLQQVEDLLDSWAGTLVVISHDRYLIERICDSTWALFGDGKLTNLPRGVDQYLERRAVDSKPASPSKPAASAAASQTSAAEHQAARKEFNAVERKMEKLNGQIATLHDKMAAHDQSDYTGLGELTAKLNAAQAEVDDLEERWLELSELVG
ncbi:glycerophosphoryl diester phosphodiesterase [Gordonia spumicola]|uniref:Glycerophosphoryl diester phosphodiesterase n=1 Tax=Gordonia spumicola TaxID=589161 RepID=A0A7I9V6G2_9ACTN|nr:ABC-F family ATP-binding cassette domain-containing protein [Gordonia spumicola]GEE00948.1 glycerophosphoryl diester phosphodiesterase [Gordonia spumicola]